MTPATGLPDLLRYLGSFALVVALLLLVLYGLKHLQRTPLSLRSPHRLALVESLSVAPRLKLVLVRVGPRELLLGVTPSAISRLSEWPLELGPTEPAPAIPPAPASAQSSVE